MFPPDSATSGVSPDGKAIVRLRHEHLHHYEFDSEKDVYRLAKRFKLEHNDPQYLYVSNSGDVVALYLHRSAAIDLYAPDGNLRKSWTLSDFMSREQIAACARTGATTQWVDEAAFYDREFVFRGPSRRVRRVSSSYTIMHSGDPDSVFAFAINCESSKLVEIDLEQDTGLSDEASGKLADDAPGKTSLGSGYRSYDGQPLPSEGANDP